jgi:hypothetical protein
MERQEWYRDYLISQGVTENIVIGRFSVSNSAERIVADIRATLGMPHKPNRGEFDDCFKSLVSSIEGAGILVMRNSIVNNNTSRPLLVEEFRSFAISDDLAPVIFIMRQIALRQGCSRWLMSYPIFGSRVIRTLAMAVASEALNGRMLLRDAARLIGVKPHKLSEYFKKEFGI